MEPKIGKKPMKEFKVILSNGHVERVRAEMFDVCDLNKVLNFYDGKLRIASFANWCGCVEAEYSGSKKGESNV